jgi:alpha-tubulin suppressor-like RCC1 family protein
MMAARDYHNIAVKADGSVWMWGANDQGQSPYEGSLEL